MFQEKIKNTQTKLLLFTETMKSLSKTCTFQRNHGVPCTKHLLFTEITEFRQQNIYFSHKSLNSLTKLILFTEIVELLNQNLYFSRKPLNSWNKTYTFHRNHWFPWSKHILFTEIFELLKQSIYFSHKSLNSLGKTYTFHGNHGIPDGLPLYQARGTCKVRGCRIMALGTTCAFMERYNAINIAKLFLSWKSLNSVSKSDIFQGQTSKMLYCPKKTNVLHQKCDTVPKNPKNLMFCKLCWPGSCVASQDPIVSKTLGFLGFLGQYHIFGTKH